MLKNESFPAKITIVIFTSFVVAAGILVYLNSSLGVVKACTVESAELISDSSGLEGPLPTTSVDIQTKECGKLTVVNLKTPYGMNKAGLAEFLKEHQGEKFEFDVQWFSIGNDVRGSSGITSTTPVE